MNREFVELSTFKADWRGLGLNDVQLRELEMALLANPKAGDVIEGTGGIRKLRFALPGRGKRGSARVIYVDFALYEKTYLLAAYAKNEQENLSKAQCNDLKRLTQTLEQELRRRR